MSLSYPELWILQTAIDMGRCWLPVHSLAEREEGDSGVNWNKPPHGLSIPEIADILWSFYQQGDIEFSDSRQTEDHRPRYRPDSKNEISSIVESGGYFIIAAAGVARWERHAKPNWSKYTDGVYRHRSENGMETWSATSMTEFRTRALLKMEARNPDIPYSIDWTSAKVEYFRPWEPFAGKRLPRGVNVSVRVTEQPSRCYLHTDGCILFNQSKYSSYLRKLVKFSRWYEHGIDDHPDRPRATK